MTDEPRIKRYRHLVARLGQAPARDLMDKLQILALIDPEAVREFEAFVDRTLSPDKADREPITPISR